MKSSSSFATYCCNDWLCKKSISRLDISFNQLETFKFSIFDQVGSATALKVNASYNRIVTLTDSNAPSFFTANFYPPPKAQSKYLNI